MELLEIKQLAYQIEVAEANIHKNFILLHQARIPGSKAQFQNIDTGIAAYVNPISPLTQAFGIGFTADTANFEENVEQINAFYKQCDAPAAVEVCHTTSPRFAEELIRQGYTLAEYSTVLVKNLQEKNIKNFDEEYFLGKGFEIIPVPNELAAVVAEVIAIGFGVQDPLLLADLVSLFQLYAQIPSARPLCAIMNGQVCAGANFLLHDNIAFLAGTSTLPEYRGRGIQTALINARLAYAKENGVKWAVVATEPGSISQKNFLKRGFQIIYARNKFIRPLPKS